MKFFILFSSRRHGGRTRRLRNVDLRADARSAHKTAHIGTTRPTPRSKRLRRCAFPTCAIVQPLVLRPQAALGSGFSLQAAFWYQNAMLAQQEKPKTQPASPAAVSYTAYNLAFLHFEFRSRYISRYEKLNLGFLTFVVATIVATAAIQAALPGSRRLLAAVFVSFAFSTRRFSPLNRIGAQISKILS